MRVFFILVGFIGVFLTSCQNSSPTHADVLVSIPPYIYFVNELTEGELTTISLVPPESNPHLYEPSPKQVALAKTAKVWVRINEGFEQKIAKSFQEQNPNLVMTNLAKELKLPHLPHEGTCKHDHGDLESVDLHFWLSLRLAKNQAELIAKALLQAFPERNKQIERTLPLLVKKLEEADSFITKELAPYSEETILVSHPAFGYFCYDYNLKQLSIECEGKDPLPKQISFILHSIHSTKIRTILTQTQYNNKGAKLIAEALHRKTHEVDPYSANYLKNLLHIAHIIAEPSS